MRGCLLAAVTLLLGCGQWGAARQLDLDGIIEMDQRSLGFEVGGRIAEVSVLRGAYVKDGDALMRLDDTLERSQRPIREAELAAAEARLQLLQAGSRLSERRAVDAQVSAASAQVEAAERELRRQEALFSRGAGTKAVLDDLETRLRRARAERDNAAERLRTLREGSRPQEVRAAAAQRDAARAQLAALDERIARYQLRAPHDGLVLDVTAKEGEVVGPAAAVVLFADPARPYVDVFVPVARLSGISVGQAAQVRPDGDSQSLDGQVEHISPNTEYTPRYILTESDRATLVTRVRVRLKDPEGRLHGGVPARVRLGPPAAEARVKLRP